MSELVREKLDQAVGVLEELDTDIWLTFVRETTLSPDPSLELILGMDMVWQSAFIVSQDGEHVAIVGKHDKENVERTGGYPTVIPYVEGIRVPLLNVLLEKDPNKIAINFSENDVAADGLSHGMMKLLKRYLHDTELAERFVSAEEIVSRVRGRKSPTELERIKQAVATTETIFGQVADFIELGKSETDIAGLVKDKIAELRLGTSWDYDYCPTITAGPDSPFGHAGPMPQYKVGRGELVHMDFGVKENEYCADIQRVWYVLDEGEDSPPTEIEQAFEAARLALHAGFDMLKPGVQGWQIDEIARQTLVDAGYPEYQHAFGHHVGRVAHDGATVLGPRWERYGDTPYGVIEAGNVFAIELGIYLDDYGYLGQEENVVVTEHGAEWLSTPQEEIWLIK